MNKWSQIRFKNGFILMIYCISIILIASYLFVIQTRNLKTHQNSVRAVHKAKEALLDYAMRNLNNNSNHIPGFLPCPDIGEGSAASEGDAQGNCGKKNVSALGRFPWKTLGTGPLRDESNECLWYAVSGTFLAAPETEMLNWDTASLLNVNNYEKHTEFGVSSTSQNRAIAVLIMPNQSLAAQKRTTSVNAPICSGNYVPQNYLDSISGINNAVLNVGKREISQFAAGISTADFNDSPFVISSSDLFDRIEKHPFFYQRINQLLEETAECLIDFAQSMPDINNHNFRLPWAAPLVLTDYFDNTAYKDQRSLLAGRLPFDVSTSINFLSPNAKVNRSQLMKGSGSKSLGCAFSAGHDEWYQHWKDQFFYVVAPGFSPDLTIPNGCTPCLKTELQSHHEYAAMIVFAGRPLPGQFRDHDGSAVTINDYLEGARIFFADYKGEAMSLNLNDNDIRWCIRADFSKAEKC